MSLGLVGVKIGMTRVFTIDGTHIPITILDVSNNYISKIKTFKSDGYYSIQLLFGKEKKISKLNLPLYGYLKKNNLLFIKKMKEFRLNNFDLLNNINLSLGCALTSNIFFVNQRVDIQGFSIGKGFSGVIKRHNFSSGRASHGNSVSHKKPGSIGMCQDPGRVLKGKRMAGHLGNKKCTVQNLKIFRIDHKRNILFILGSVPGGKNNNVFIFPSVKVKKNINNNESKDIT